MLLQIEELKERDQSFPLWSIGFRPFFFLASLQASLMVLLWLLMLGNVIPLPRAIPALYWHAHEMLYGFVGATITGFLLTAVPKWTGTSPIRGASLILLTVLWLGARLSLLMPNVGADLAPAWQLGFWAVLLYFITRPIVLSHNWRNLKVVAIIALLLSSNALFYLGHYAFAVKLALWLITLLMALIGSRIIPGFTRNWLSRQVGAPFNTPGNSNLPNAAMAALIGAALFNLAPLPAALQATALALAAVLLLVTAGGWQGHKTLREPLLWILHIGYLFIPVSLLLRACALLSTAMPVSAATHALTAGAMGCLIIGVMSRASRGHSGRELKAGYLEVAVFLAVIMGALLRVAATIAPQQNGLLEVSGLLWSAGFALFAVGYAPCFFKPELRLMPPNRQ